MMKDNNSFGKKVARMVVIVVCVLASLMLVSHVAFSGFGFCNLCFGDPQGEAWEGSVIVLFAGAIGGAVCGWIPILLLCWLGRRVLTQFERKLFLWFPLGGVLFSVLSFGLGIYWFW